MDILGSDNLVLALDVWIVESDKVEMIGQTLPLDDIFYAVPMTDVAFPPDIRDRLHIGVYCSEEETEIRDGTS